MLLRLYASAMRYGAVGLLRYCAHPSKLKNMLPNIISSHHFVNFVKYQQDVALVILQIKFTNNEIFTGLTINGKAIRYKYGSTIPK
jgi:hypothetical protein